MTLLFCQNFCKIDIGFKKIYHHIMPSTIKIDDLVQNVSKLNITDLTIFFDQLNQTIIGQKTLLPLGEEAILLKRIKQIIPATIIRRFKVLQKKQYNHTITQKEQAEILIITDFIEEKSAERVILLAKLANIRQVSLPVLAKQMRLKSYHA
jgi:hypothetical protein